MENKNELQLKKFTAYCEAHPSERFWQALRNWALIDDGDACFILKASSNDILANDTTRWFGVRDTFYED